MPAADRALSLIIRAAEPVGPEELYPPAQYSGWWLLLALGIVLAIVLVVVLIVAFTREPRGPREPQKAPEGTAAQQLDRLRYDSLSRIDAVERAFADGRLDARGVNVELSSITRRFVNEYTGVATPVMSLEEIEHQHVHPALLQALGAYYYPSIFGEDPPADPRPGIAAAREVVTAWH